jgi:hypothetical protein
MRANREGPLQSTLESNSPETVEGELARIFINYRTSDTGDAASRLYDVLASAYGPESVFLDYKSIEGGAQWLRQLGREAASASVMLGLIGSKWLSEQDETTGRRKLDREDDYVRREIEAAMSSGSVVIPLLVNDTPLPDPHSLGNIPSLAAFLHLQAMKLRRTDWETDVAQLKQRVEEHGFRPVRSPEQSREFQTLQRKYMEHLHSWHKRLTTPGAKELQGVSQSLSIAYISLTVRTGLQEEPVPAESIIRNNPLVVIRGPAGSGKTTLLTWIVWSCADDQGESAWRGSVPFLIPLRTVARVDDGAPRVANFVKYSLSEAFWPGGPQDADWIEDVLRVQKRGIVLLDGFDELPPGRRELFWQWLANFVEMFPGNRVVVTSRTLPGFLNSVAAKTTNDWNPPPGFLDVHLEPMTNPDVHEFIRHWHDSVDSSRLDMIEKAGLQRARDQLPVRLEDPGNRAIREICSTPLLCAMVCVLHWREEGTLPGARVDLYAKCCDMLIDGRDVKREIPPPVGPVAALTKDDKELVARWLALDMMRSRPDGDETTDYRMEISRAKAIEWITPRIPSFKREEARAAKPEDVLDYLLLRSGLLREPAADLVDFPHRSFQEYLAACAAGAESQEQDLAKRANDDRWHETIMMAAGTPTGGVHFGRELIEALLARAQRFKSPKASSQRTRKTCLALALGCLESFKGGDAPLRERVFAYLTELVPPRDENGARILAVARDAALPHLAYERWKDEDVATVTACAQTLRLIDTASAQSALEIGYATDDRTSVVVEVTKTGAIPLSRIPAVVRLVQATGELPDWVDVADAQLVVGLDHLRRLRMSGRLPRNHPEIGQMTNLTGLSLVNLDRGEISSLRWPANLRDVEIESSGSASGSATSLPWIAEIPSLERLTVRLKKSALNLADLTRSLSLQQLELHSVEQDLTPLGGLVQLRKLLLDACVDEGNFAFLSTLTNLQALTLANSRGPNIVQTAHSDTRFSFDREFGLHDDTLHYSPLWRNRFGMHDWFYRPSHYIVDRHPKAYDSASLSSLVCLHTLTLQNLESLSSLEAISGHQHLEQLSLIDCFAIPTLPNFAGMQALRHLQLIGLRADGFDRLIGATGLQAVVISRCPRFVNLRYLAALPELSTIVLSEQPVPDQLEDFKQLSSMTRLVLCQCSWVTDLSFIEGMGSLRHLVLAHLPSVHNLDALKTLPGLRQLTLLHMDGLESFEALATCGGLERVEVSNDIFERLADTVPASSTLSSIGSVKADALISSGQWWQLLEFHRT